MAKNTTPVAFEASTTNPFALTTDSTDQTTLFNVQDYLEDKNHEFVSTLAPTLSYMAVLVVFGLAGNSVVFVVYYRRFKPSVTRTYILAMSVVDLLTNVLSLPADIVEVRFHNTFEERWVCKGIRTIKSFLGFLSAFILVAVAFDRQRAICGQQSTPMTVKRTLVVLVIVSACALGFTLPYSVVTGSRTLTYPDSNVTGVECSIDDVYFQSTFLFVYNVITGLVLIVCITLMLGSYIRIARQLWLHKKNTATIMGMAAGAGGGAGRKASTMSTNTYTFDDSSSSERTHSSSERSQHSFKAGNDPAKPDLTSAQRGNTPAIQEEPLEASCAETALNGAENPSYGTCPCANDDLADTTPSPTKHADSNPERTETPANQPLPRDATHAASSEAKLHTSGRKPSVTIQSDPSRSSSRSRAALSRIRQTASDARSFVMRKKSSTTSIRSSVKKIPTRTTFMMFVLTVIFIINYLPYLLTVSIRSRMGDDYVTAGMGMNGYHIGLRSYFLNSAVNPLVYSFCSARFRQECRRLFNCCKKQ